MLIDRRRFFTLTATLAASHAACASPPPPVIAVPAEIDPAEAKAARSADQPRAPAIAEAPRADEPAADVQAHTLGPSEENSAAPLTLKGMSCAPSENLKGSPGVCGTLRAPGPTCESFKDTKNECQQLTRMFKPRVAEKIVSCLQKKSGTQAICRFGVSGECMMEGIASACVDPKTTSSCAQVMSRCGTTRWGNITHDACAAALSGVQDSSRTVFLACMSESCRLEGCEYSFLAPIVESKRPILRH